MSYATNAAFYTVTEAVSVTLTIVRRWLKKNLDNCRQANIEFYLILGMWFYIGKPVVPQSIAFNYLDHNCPVICNLKPVGITFICI